MGTILAIDPGNIQSGYVIVEHDGEEIRRVLDAGKKGNHELLPMLERKLYGNGCDVAIEMIAGMGMTVGQEVFDTCVWIGRFWQTVVRLAICQRCKHPAGPRRPLRARPAELWQGYKERPRLLLRFLSGYVGGYGSGCDVF